MNIPMNDDIAKVLNKRTRKEVDRLQALALSDAAKTQRVLVEAFGDADKYETLVLQLASIAASAELGMKKNQNTHPDIEMVMPAVQAIILHIVRTKIGTDYLREVKGEQALHE